MYMYIYIYVYIHVPLLAKSGGRVNSLDNNTPKAPLPMLTLALFLLVCNPTVGLLDPLKKSESA